jgi:hypothetical protein
VALAGSSVDLVLTIWAYYDEGLTPTHVTFAVTIFTAVTLYATWFWGTFLAMNGTIPPRRLVYLIVHTLIGFMAPLVYTVSVTQELDSIGSQPLGDVQLTLSFWGLIVVLAQFVTGWSVLRRRPWRLMARQATALRRGSLFGTRF